MNTAELNAASEQAAIYAGKGEFSKAFDILLGLPESPDRNKRLADLYNDQGYQQLITRKPPSYEGAIEAYKNAINYDPNNAQYRNNRAEAYYELALSRSDDRKVSGNYLSLAQQDCENVLSRDGKNLEALKILKRVAVQKHDDVLLAKTLNRIIEASLDGPDAAKARQDLNELKLR